MSRFRIYHWLSYILTGVLINLPPIIGHILSSVENIVVYGNGFEFYFIEPLSCWYKYWMVGAVRGWTSVEIGLFNDNSRGFKRTYY